MIRRATIDGTTPLTAASPDALPPSALSSETLSPAVEFAQIRRRTRRLLLAALTLTAAVIAAHLAAATVLLDGFDPALAATDAILAIAALLGAWALIRSDTRERRRHAVESLLPAHLAIPRGIRETAESALELIARSGLGEAATIVVAAPDTQQLTPIAATGYPPAWLGDAPAVPHPAAEHSAAQQRARIVRRSDVPDAVDSLIRPLDETIGERSWVALVPLHSDMASQHGDLEDSEIGESLGLLLLTARRRGALGDAALIETIGRQLAAALGQAAIYEVSYERERSLEEQNRLRRDFMSAMSHEIRTPLSSIQASAELLSREAVGAREQAAPLLSSLSNGVDRLNSVVNDLLDLARIEEGGMRAELTRVDAVALLAHARELVHPAYIVRGQTIELELPEEGLWASADPRQLEQITLNLLVNANRHTPPGGSVIARLTATDDGRVRIEVEDTGPGVDPEDRTRIFEPYYRVQRPGAVEVPGSGLGLAVARHLTDLQGGRIWVEEAAGGGARFCVELAAAQPAEANREAAGERPNAAVR